VTERARPLLVLNAGSSSLKFCRYEAEASGEPRPVLRGQIEGLGTAPRLQVEDAEGRSLADRALDAARVKDVRGALRVLAEGSEDLLGATPAAVGHRVVHGGARYREPVRIDDEVASELERLVPLAPLHQPANLHAIAAARLEFPAAMQVACFDTAFHATMPEVAQVVPLPAELRGDGLRRYGFHGLSYEYVASALRELDPALADGRVIVAHLGSGASLCALRNGRSVDTTLGFTALDGLCMGTRPGALDPGVVLHLFQGRGLSAAEVEDVLYRRSGLLGLSGLSNDMRVLLASDDPRARLAVDYFVYRAAKEMGALAAVLGGLDGLVFTAGIGENSPEIRRRIAAASRWLGVELDQAANARGESRISAPSSRVRVLVVPTDEERVIARHVLRLLGPTG
jgi:acetate kinase